MIRTDEESATIQILVEMFYPIDNCKSFFVHLSVVSLGCCECA